MFVCAACSSAIESTSQFLSCPRCAVRLVWADVYKSALAKVSASSGVNAPDLVQGAFLELLDRRANGQPRSLALGSLPSFIACIARRRHIDRLRRGQRLAYHDDIEAISENESLWQYLAGGEDAERGELREELRHALFRLAGPDPVGVIARLLLDEPDFEPTVRRLAARFGWTHHEAYLASKAFLGRVRADLGATRRTCQRTPRV